MLYVGPILKQGWVKSYLDDGIVCAPSFDCLLQWLGQVFKLMEEVGIKFNLSKCHIGQQEIKFLDHKVSKDGIKPDPENVEAVEKMKPPTNVKETRRFLGMAGFYRKYIEKERAGGREKERAGESERVRESVGPVNETNELLVCCYVLLCVLWVQGLVTCSGVNMDCFCELKDPTG